MLLSAAALCTGHAARHEVASSPHLSDERNTRSSSAGAPAKTQMKIYCFPVMVPAMVPAPMAVSVLHAPPAVPVVVEVPLLLPPLPLLLPLLPVTVWSTLVVAEMIGSM